MLTESVSIYECGMDDAKKYFESPVKLSIKMALLIIAVLGIMFLIWKIKSVYEVKT